jgi:hypothetical protein
MDGSDSLFFLRRVGMRKATFCVIPKVRGLLPLGGYCHWVATATGWLLPLGGYCLWVATATGWLLPLGGYFHGVGTATGWLLPLGGYCHWVATASGWLLPLDGLWNCGFRACTKICRLSPILVKMDKSNKHLTRRLTWRLIVICFQHENIVRWRQALRTRKQFDNVLRPTACCARGTICCNCECLCLSVFIWCRL